MIEITQEMIDEARALGIGVDAFDESTHKWNTKPYTAIENVNGDPVLDGEGNPVLDDQGNPTYEQVPTEVIKHKITGLEVKPIEVPQLPVFKVVNPVITSNSQVINPVNGFYYVQQGVPIQITTTAQLENGEAITLPPPLALPIVMFDANNQPTLKKYAPTTVTAGEVQAVVTLTEGGAWKITEHFVNESLAEVGQQWAVEMDTYTFLVM